MTMAMVVVSMVMRVSMAVMCVAKGGEAHDVDEEAENTDNEEFVQSLQFMTLP